METGVFRVFSRLLVAGVLAALISEAAAQGVWIEVGPAVRGGRQFQVTDNAYVQTWRRLMASAPLLESTDIPRLRPRQPDRSSGVSGA